MNPEQLLFPVSKRVSAENPFPPSLSITIPITGRVRVEVRYVARIKVQLDLELIEVCTKLQIV